MFEIDPCREAFRTLEKREASKVPPELVSLRRTAFSRFTELGFPTPREEEWKYTNVSPLLKHQFKFSIEQPANGLTAEEIHSFRLSGLAGAQLVFVNGLFSPKLSHTGELPSGVKAASLSEALIHDPGLVRPELARTAPYGRNGFTALNTAFIHDGAFIHLSRGSGCEKPIHLVFITQTPSGPLISQPRNLIVLEAGSRAAVIESYYFLDGKAYLTNAVTEIVLKEDASLDYYKVQREDARNGFHVATTGVRQDRNSRFFSFSISLGAKLEREDLNVLLGAEGSECTLNGLYLVSDGQHIDHHTVIDHLKPQGTSHQLYKGILKGKSHAVFNGKVFVREDARKSDAEQVNKNLLLSDEAGVDTKPQLEISNDDVKCTHGAAVGQLDEDALFYLKSRGLDDENSRDLLTHGFAADVINRARIDAVRMELDRELWAWLQNDHLAGETK
ncbi:MAG: Fe-S cluster assembly protein SufD [Candidatus Omnitrophica bacterium]|nr:Fe-S cluster assembly protein SufD [Candidatus Omnitrophota bacterium]